MGLRGPAPKPTSLRVIEGNRSKRPLPPGEPDADGKARCPSWLSPEARRVWSKLAPICDGMGVLKAADENLFAAFCDSVATVKEMSAFIQEHGRTETVISREGNLSTVVRPEVKIMLDEKKLALQIGSRFGLTASDRTRINVGKQEDDNPFKKLGVM